MGAGYELARRDLEMRGYGSLFGYDQTGAVDIGPDLECMYLSRELKAVKESILLPSKFYILFHVCEVCGPNFYCFCASS